MISGIVAMSRMPFKISIPICFIDNRKCIDEIEA
jgi:hypothetical protein